MRTAKIKGKKLSERLISEGNNIGKISCNISRSFSVVVGFTNYGHANSRKIGI